jgi:hypothetical protein
MLLDEPAEHLGRAVSAVCSEPFRIGTDDIRPVPGTTHEQRCLQGRPARVIRFPLPLHYRDVPGSGTTSMFMF